MTGLKKRFIINVLLALLMTGIGNGLIAGGSVLKSRNDRLIRDWPHAEGTVVGYEIKDGDEDTMYSEVVEFEVDGETYRITGSSSSNIRPVTGKKREVAYNPENPQDGIIVSENRITNIAMFGVGGLFTAIGVLALITAAFKYRKDIKNTLPENANPAGMQAGSGAPFASSYQNGQSPQPFSPAQNGQPFEPFEEFDPKNRS